MLKFPGINTRTFRFIFHFNDIYNPPALRCEPRRAFLKFIIKDRFELIQTRSQHRRQQRRQIRSKHGCIKGLYCRGRFCCAVLVGYETIGTVTGRWVDLDGRTNLGRFQGGHDA